MGPGLPDGADELTADFVSAAVLVFHQTLGGGENADTEAVEDARDFAVAVIKAAAWSRGTLQVRNNRSVFDVLEFNDDGLVAVGVCAVGEVDHIALRFEDRSDAFLEFGVRSRALGETGLARIAEAGQKITNRICHGGMFYVSAVGPYPTSGSGNSNYQEDFVTPGILPARASSRKVRRETRKRRM